MEIAESGGRFFKRDGPDGQPIEISPAEYAQISTAKDTGPLESFLVGAGRTFSNIGENLGLMEPSDGGGAMSALRDQNPWSTMAGEVAPMLAPVPGGAVAQMAAGGGLGYLGSNEQEGSQGGAAALGAAGGLAGHIVGRVASRVAGARSQNPIGMRQAAQDVYDTGGNVRLGEATGSDAIKTLERAIEVTPGGKAAYAGTRGARDRNVNRLMRDALDIGDQNLKGFGDDAVEAAYDVVGSKFDNVRDAIPDMTVPAGLADDLRTYLGTSSRLKATLSKKGAQGFDADGPMQVTGDSLMDMRSRILKRNKTPSNDSPIYDDIIESIDDLVEANAPPGLIDDWADARSNYRLLKIAEKSRSGKGISPAKLSNRMTDWRGAEGKIGDLRKNVKGLTSGDFTNTFGNSGTPEGLLGMATLPLSPLTYSAGAGLNSLLDLGNVGTRTGAALGRGAGLFSGVP